MIDTLLDTAIEILQEWGITNLSHSNQLLGLWHGERKLASMGIAIEKLTTFHGMALNFYQDEEMKKALVELNPCGLKAETYTSVEEIINLKDKNLEVFSHLFLRRISYAWK
jgi:lipoate-protein ligase B